MPAAELLLRADALPKEFQKPVSHSPWWLVVALLLLAAVAAYYLVVTVLTRQRRPASAPEPAPVAPARDVRAEHLAEISRIEQAVSAGDLPARIGHQQLSKTVRGYVSEVSRLPADRMILADLRAAIRHDPRAAGLADAVAVMYPPAFAADEEGHAGERFPEAVGRAKEVVTRWT